ncbi:RRP6-like 2 [Olea europaea subsp. europaea]|uniref:RRP6-like 2 n=1 Tax=Olea europaea subsp. europaea TaxID=158383 RepID=A0A8S0PAW9_OLEEU|nr:RRP6-like 2 [Olea europaea subsp. europaea]
MQIDRGEDEDSKKSQALRTFATKGPLPISMAKLSGSSRGIPSERDFHFYNNFQEFKNSVKETDQKSENLLKGIGESENLFMKPIAFPDDIDIELDDDVEYDWLTNVNDDIFERFDASLDEFKRLRKKEEESGVRMMRVDGDDDMENGFQIVHGKKNKKLMMERNVEEGVQGGVQEVKVAAKVKPKVPFHVPTIRKPQEEYKIIVNNSNQPHEHVWLQRSEDGSRFIHPLEKLSVHDFVDKKDNITEPVKPCSLESTPFKLVEEVKDLKQLAIKLRNVDEFAIDLEHNQYRSFQGLTCLMQISTRTEDFVIDTLKLRIHIGPYLREVFKDPTKKKVIHGADRDIIWLQKDFGIYVCNMFDTGQASRVLKMERNSLEYLLHHFCGVKANKEYQNADWRLRPLPHEMIRYAREDTHYLLYIYDVMRMMLLTSSAESESSDPPLLEVYKRSYGICMQLYEKELLTDSSYLYIYGLQGAGLNAQQLAVVSGLYEWRDVVARAEDESTGYILPNRTLIEIAKQMPLTASKLRRLLKSKLPYVERNLGSVVSIIRHSIQNAHAFEEAAKYLQERRLETAIEDNALITEESEVLPPEAPEIINSSKEVENINGTSSNDSISKNTLASMECKDGAPMIGSSNDRVTINIQEGSHLLPGERGDVKSKTDGCTATSQRDMSSLSNPAEATVQVLKKPSRAFGALLGNSAKRKFDPDKKEQEETKLEQIKSSVNLPFHTFSGEDERLQSDVIESAKPLEVQQQAEVIPTPATGSNLGDVILLSDDSDMEESGNGDTEAPPNDQPQEQENNTTGSAEEIDEEDVPISLSDLSSSFQKCFPASNQTRESKASGKSQLSDFLQVKPFDFEAARKQVKFGEDNRREKMEANDGDDKIRLNKGDKKKSSVISQKDEDGNDLPQGRRRQAFPASGNRSATFR